MAIYGGRIPAGISLLDESMLEATSRSLEPVLLGNVYCTAIEGCQEVSDLRRVEEWTQVLQRWCEEQPGLVTFTGQCALHRGQVMLARGAWDEAAEELTAASSATGWPGPSRPSARPRASSATCTACAVTGPGRRGVRAERRARLRPAAGFGPAVAGEGLRGGRAGAVAATARRDAYGRGPDPGASGRRHGAPCRRRPRGRTDVRERARRTSPGRSAPTCSRRGRRTPAVSSSSRPTTRPAPCPTSAGPTRAGCDWTCPTRQRSPRQPRDEPSGARRHRVRPPHPGGGPPGLRGGRGAPGRRRGRPSRRAAARVPRA